MIIIILMQTHAFFSYIFWYCAALIWLLEWLQIQATLLHCPSFSILFTRSNNRRSGGNTAKKEGIEKSMFDIFLEKCMH